MPVDRPTVPKALTTSKAIWVRVNWLSQMAINKMAVKTKVELMTYNFTA